MLGTISKNGWDFCWERGCSQQSGVPKSRPWRINGENTFSIATSCLIKRAFLASIFTSLIADIRREIVAA